MIYLFLADGFEEVEAITPVDYIRRCGLEISTVGVTGKKVKGAHDITISADKTIDEFDPHSENDMIILPGGLDGTNNLRSNDKVIESIKNSSIKLSLIP
ncbi:MAG: DJ-1/PfpI family protein, partial [Oscillospiraceae bacterium]|nr:DJ-1/PfpI family protein [Oscillospiraceae bacterium]